MDCFFFVVDTNDPVRLLGRLVLKDWSADNEFVEELTLCDDVYSSIRVEDPWDVMEHVHIGSRTVFTVGSLQHNFQRGNL